MLNKQVMQFFSKEIEKVAKEKEKPSVGDIGLLGLGAYGTKRLGDAGLERALGVQRFIHGTSDRAADSILRTGLDPSHGGREGGSSAGIGSDRFIEESKGKVHVARDNMAGRRFVASPHAALAQAAEEARLAGDTLPKDSGMDAFKRGLVGLGDGTIIGGAMPFNEFAEQFEQDPDHVPYITQRSTRGIGADKLRRGRAGTLDILGNIRLDQLGSYIANNPGRFGRGLLYGGGALGVGKLTKDKAESIYDKYKE